MNSIFTPSLLRQLPLALLSGVILTVLKFKSETVHMPFLLNVVFSFGLGWLQPQRGWVLAALQLLTIVLLYLLLLSTGWLVPARADIAQFTTYLAIFPTLAGSFMGAFLRRAILKG